MIDCVVEPSDQVFPEELDEVNVTDPPEQNVVAPPADIVGVEGIGFTVTVSRLDVAVHDPFVLLTV